MWTFLNRVTRIRPYFSKFFLEMIPVIAGVLLAFAINNWNEQSNDREFVTKIMASVTMELGENSTELERVIAEHRLFMDTVKTSLRDDTITVADLLTKSGGFRMVNVKNTSWKSFLTTKMELLDYQAISLLSGIDESRQTMRIQAEKLVDFVYGSLMANERAKKNLLWLMVNDLLTTEQGLLDMHEEFLKAGSR